MSGRSGYCTPAFGSTFHADSSHLVCEMLVKSGDVTCNCDEYGAHSAPEPFANGGKSRDNGGEESDPALRQQPGSRPNSSEESDVTDSTRKPPRSHRGRD